MAEKVTETWVSTPKKLFTAKREACLVHIYPTGPTMGCRYPLTDRPLVLGRGEDSDIRLTDHSVSRKHALIEPAVDGYHVSDQNSTNGTFVNDKQLETSRLLSDGDYLRVGNCLYRYLAGGNIEAEYHEEIYRLTILDGLTQIHNQRYLDEFLEREVVRSQRHHRPLSVLAIDIDKFKTINDSLGHLCGDFVLRELAGVIRGIVRQEDLFARSGGEEFVVVLVETTLEGALQVAERIREAVAEHQFRFETTPVNLTISIGLASTMGDDNASTTDLRHTADQKLYEAKRTGRNRVCS
ncbi:GGDEF domain-containing protein [Gemmata sp. G18]|uniref:diguanylate cyclase n=1 Tax=Gemmata palustris TaxID=2822762 RepID=A0ABS5C613_9BACT|nr:GGDEF domain-containing protein [Gemmata palustris]